MYDAPGSVPARALTLTQSTTASKYTQTHTAGIFTPPLYLPVVYVWLGAGEKRILDEYLDLAPHWCVVKSKRQKQQYKILKINNDLKIAQFKPSSVF